LRQIMKAPGPVASSRVPTVGSGDRQPPSEHPDNSTAAVIELP
jgi:hypothetical protein